jgi:Arylsulfotransferase (ASST)
VPLPRVLLAVLVSVATLGLAPAITQSAAAGPPPAHTLAVSGTDVAMYPAFAAATHRYGVTTKADTAGTVTVAATTTDPAGTVWVDGRPASGGVATLTGLASGDEISVFIKDSAGTAVYSLVYLPAGFPALTVTTSAPGIAPGDVFMTLTDFKGMTPSYETDVDNNGVPAFVHTDPAPVVPLDFKRQPNGDYSVFRAGQEIELNSQYQQIGAFGVVAPLTTTDGHDSIFLPNGDRYLLATQPRGGTGADSDEMDAFIQEQAPDGHVLFQWDSADHVNPATDTMVAASNVMHNDYAHINSISIMANGDILASFRHLSAVLEIARTAHDGFASGAVVWELGGRHSSFSFPAGDGGPCAQHAASELPNGHILLFDDGSESINNSPLLCVNPSDPSGPAIARPTTRVVEYSLDPAGTTPRNATQVSSYSVDGRVTSFAGSAQRLSNGNTMVGWASATNPALATEVNAVGTPVWELKDSAGLFSYRALRFAAPDAIVPAVQITTPATGATYTFGQQVPSSFSCTDHGGSSLQSCGGPARFGAAIDTSTVGRHSYTVVAKDGAGNTRTVVRRYTVTAGSTHFQPDAQIKAGAAGRFVGGNVYGGPQRQHIRQSIGHAGRSKGSRVRFQNDGSTVDRITIKGTAGHMNFHVRYFVGGRNVTRQVTGGTYRTPVLAPGRTQLMRITVTRTRAARPHRSRTVTLTGTSVDDPARHDAVATIVRATR